jgi:ribonuclease BN (tRNA processing enzyme)
MRVFPIGVGTAFGRRLFNTNLIVEFDSHNFLLVDCGITASRSLETIGKSVLAVENLFVSHLHADHIGGIEELALKAKLILNRKINLYIHEQLVEPFWESIKGGIQFTQLGRLALSDYFNVMPYRDRFSLEGLEFTSRPTHHVEGMLSFDLSFGSCLLTGDTVFSIEYVLDRAQGFDIVVHDCSFNDFQKVHAYYQDLLDHRDLFKKLLVIHYEDHIDKFKKTLSSSGIGICHQYADIV